MFYVIPGSFLSNLEAEPNRSLTSPYMHLDEKTQAIDGPEQHVPIVAPKFR